MELNQLRPKAIDFMLQRGWRKKIAKKEDYEQSLFEHTRLALDSAIGLMPILEKNLRLNDDEVKSILIAIVAHDAGKENDEWQREALLGEKPPSHIDLSVVPELVQMFDLADSQSVINGIKLHMASTAKDGAVLTAIVSKNDEQSIRWKLLADIVYAVDKLISAKGVITAKSIIEDSSDTRVKSIFKFLGCSYHLVQIRGVSTTLLHQAALDAFTAKGWQPLIYYSDGTLYVSDSTTNVQQPMNDEIKREFEKTLEIILNKTVTPLLVGNPTKTILPKPELIDYRDIDKYLTEASRKVTVQTFSRKSLEDKNGRNGRRSIILNYLDRDVTDDEVKEFTSKFSSTYPEMSVFCFFKAFYKQFIEKDGEAKKHFKEAYERVFGIGTFALFLKSSAQLNPANHYRLVIEPFDQVSLEAIRGLGISLVDEESVSSNSAKHIRQLVSSPKRIQILVAVLTFIVRATFDVLPLEKRPTRISGQQLAERLLSDLVYPSIITDFGKIIAQQLDHYLEAKPNASKNNDKKHICPICNEAFQRGVLANDNLIVSAGSFTNRVSVGETNVDTIICSRCQAELFLQQIILQSGSSIKTMIVAFPRMNVSCIAGNLLKTKVEELWNKASLLMSEETPDFLQEVNLKETSSIAQKLGSIMNSPLSSEEILSIITRQSTERTKKDTIEKLISVIEEERGDKLPVKITTARVKQKEVLDPQRTVELLNDEWEEKFDSWDSLLEAFFTGYNFRDDTPRLVRRNVFKIKPQFRIVCQTPNMIIVPMYEHFARKVKVGDKFKDESEVNSALRELFISVIIGLALDSSVAVLNYGDKITFEGGEGVAFVPRVPALRELLRKEWIPLRVVNRSSGEIIDYAEKLVYAIGAAARLAYVTNYSETSNIFQVLKSPTSGHLLRRIELERQKKYKDNYVSHEQLQLIHTIKEIF